MALIPTRFGSRRPIELQWIWRTWGLVILYLGWAHWVQIVSLSVVTYSLFSGSNTPRSGVHTGKLQEIGDLFSSSHLFIAGLTSLIFIFVWRALYPLTGLNQLSAVLSLSRIRTSFLPAALRGATLALSLVLANMLAGYYRPIGFFVQLDEAALAMIILVGKSLALLAMVYCEEFIFRKKLLENLLIRLPKESAIAACAGLYVLLKWIQFDLGWMQTFTLLLMSLILTIKASYRKDFAGGAGQWFAILWVLHILFGLPVLGLGQTGVFSLLYTGPTLDIDWGARLERLLTGGLAGPLSSLVLQVTLLLSLAFIAFERMHRAKNFRLNALLKPLR